MPANRSRTLEWRRCLQQVCDRKGSLEIAFATGACGSGAGNGSSAPARNGVARRAVGADLVWRVRLLSLSESEILIEHPTALGRAIPLEPGAPLIAILSIGQNRWTFATVNMGPTTLEVERRPTSALRLTMPDAVKRQRRAHQRLEIEPLALPEVEMWPLLDPRSVVVAERAHQIQHEMEVGCISDDAPGGQWGRGGGQRVALNDDAVMPEVGPRFRATLLNLGGGGLGLSVAGVDAQSLVRHKLFWMRFALPPVLATPICATGKLAHTHIESNHDTYAGLAFDFTFNPGHQKFVVEQICRYIALQQRARLEHAEAALQSA